MDSSWIFEKDTGFKANSRWIHYLIRAFTFSVSRIHFTLKTFLRKSAWINDLYRKFTLNTLSHSRISDEYTICFANSLWIRYLFRECTWIQYFFREFTINSLSFRQIHYLFRRLNSYWLFGEETMNSLLFSHKIFELSIFFANLL